MMLYKYLSSRRISVIRKCQIRFTQYGDFNDPFELNPNIDKLAEENEIRNLISKDFMKIVEEEYSQHPIIRNFISKDDFIKLAQAQEETVKNTVVGIEPHIVKLLPDMLQKTVNSLMGALSLSELDDHELMWSHYAEEHKGYVIGFDSSHPFFDQRKSSEDELRHLRKMEYKDKPPTINLMRTNVAELFFVKSLRWQYENEWRILLPLSDSDEVFSKEPYPIHLFNFPLTAVKRLILGAKIATENELILRSLLHDKQYSHIELCKANLDSSSFGIVINKTN